MPNIVLTTRCNRNCEYCFALEVLHDNSQPYIDFQEIVNIADRIGGSNDRAVGLLGGEPTLHPQFVEILRYFIERGIYVSIFTNGICSDSVHHKLDKLDHHRNQFRFIVNTNPPALEPERNRTRQDMFLTRYALSCDLSINIFNPDISLDFGAEVTQRTGLKDCRIRVGIAQPIAGESNSYLPLSAYGKAAADIVHLAELVFERNITVNLDCGFPLCSFSNEQLGALRRMNAGLRFICDMAVDFAPQLSAWSCFPMATQCVIKYDPFSSMDQVTERFREMTNNLRGQMVFGLYPECTNCIYRRNAVCAGGCLSHSLNRHKNNQRQLAMS